MENVLGAVEQALCPSESGNWRHQCSETFGDGECFAARMARMDSEESAMSSVITAPKPGDVKACIECGRTTAVYAQVSNSLFVSADRATYPGRVPDVYAWKCSTCGHEERDAPPLPHADAHT
jgi:hypothetical protein